MQSTDRAFQLAFARLPPAAESQRRAHHISSLIIPFSHRYFLCLTGSQSYRPEVTKRSTDLHTVLVSLLWVAFGRPPPRGGVVVGEIEFVHELHFSTTTPPWGGRDAV